MQRFESSMKALPGLARSRRPTTVAVALSLLCVLAVTGCSRFRKEAPSKYVYVTARETFLRDRVAAVSNRTATVANGDKLKVLDRGRRFIKVRTEKGEVGWIDDKLVVTGDVLTRFDELKDEHQKDPVVATAVARDEVYLHLTPGRETEHFYRLNEGAKLSLLRRATLVKTASPGAARAQRSIPQAVGSTKAKNAPELTPQEKQKQENAAPPLVMEDWWLVRDRQGHTGWLYARMMDVDVPDSVGKYAEGQRMVGAYVLDTVNDPTANDTGGVNVPMYVTVLSPYKAGLPYDFDQVRVFTWNLKKHRYETAFREHGVEGYLPVTVTREADPYARPGSDGAQPAPTFRVKLLAADAPPVVPDPTTGQMVPTKIITQTFRLEGNIIRRVAPPGSPQEPVAHPEPADDKQEKAKAKKHR